MKCDACNGQGEMFIINGNPDYAIPETLTCEKCKGTGQLEVGNVAQPDSVYVQLDDVPDKTGGGYGVV